jgi:hypothetical protein
VCKPNSDHAHQRAVRPFREGILSGRVYVGGM